MAEAVFRNMVDDAGLARQIEVDSAGTGSWHVGDPPHSGAQAILRTHSIGVNDMQARQIQPHDLERFDYLAVMDGDNERTVSRLAQRYGLHVETIRLLDFADPAITGGVRDVPDPYYDGGFDYVYELVRSGCEGLLAHIMDGG